MRRYLFLWLLICLSTAPCTAWGAETVRPSTLLQRLQFSSAAREDAAVPLTLDSPVLHTTFHTTSFTKSTNSMRLKDLVPESEKPTTQGLLAVSTWLDGKFITEGELARNTTDSLLTSSLGGLKPSEPSERMLRFAMTSNAGAIRYGVNYRTAGSGFFNLPDQTMQEVWGEWQWGFTKFRSALGEKWNNVDSIQSQQRIEQQYSRIGLAVSRPSWPELSLTYVRNTSESVLNPEGFTPLRNQSNSFEGTLSYAGHNWKARLSTSYILTRDELQVGGDAVGFAQMLTGSYSPFENLKISPTFGYRTDHQRWSGLQTVTPSASLSLQYKQSRRLLISALGGYTNTRTNDGTIDTESVNSKGVLSWDLDVLVPYIKHSAVLAFEAGYTHIMNRVSPSLESEDISGLVRFLIAAL